MTVFIYLSLTVNKILVDMRSVGVRILRVLLGGNQGSLVGDFFWWDILLCWSHEPCFSYMELPPFPLCCNNMLLFPRMEKEGKKNARKGPIIGLVFLAVWNLKLFLFLAVCVREKG